MYTCIYIYLVSNESTTKDLFKLERERKILQHSSQINLGLRQCRVLANTYVYIYKNQPRRRDTEKILSLCLALSLSLSVSVSLSESLIFFRYIYFINARMAVKGGQEKTRTTRNVSE